MGITRRAIQVVLGLLWLLDGALQLQPFMFGPGFAHQVIAPAAEGQPGFVAVGVHWAVSLIGTQPVVWDYLFAVAQLLIGLGLLVPATVRPALVASIGWALGVWYMGEGLGGLASGHADMLTGAPGAALMYAVLGVAAWPRTTKPTRDPALHSARRLPPAWLPVAWAALWVGDAVLRALPGQNTTAALAGEISGNVDGAPLWLAHVDQSVAAAVRDVRPAAVVVLVLLELAIGVAGLLPGAVRWLAATAGIALSLCFWVVGQSLGELYTGQATDPDTAPLVILMALAMASVPALRTATSRATAETGSREPATE